MKDNLHGGDVWQFSPAERRAMADFSVNTGPLGMAASVERAIRNSVGSLCHYPEPDSKNLKRMLAGFHGLNSDNFVIGNGSIELVHLVPRAIGARSVLIPVPTFSEYEIAARANGSRCIFVKGAQADGFKINIKKLIPLSQKTDLVFLCNPNNPTGAILDRDDILPLAKSCARNGTVLVIDEAFMDFAKDSGRATMIRECARRRNIIVLRSLTKFFAVPGIRIGYAAGHKDIVERLACRMYPWNVNTIAQGLAGAALNDRHFARQTKDIVRRERQYLYRRLAAIKQIRVFPSDANFFLCKILHGRIKDASDLNRRLIGDGISIRPCGNFRGLDMRFFRVAVKDRRSNMKLVSILRKILE